MATSTDLRSAIEEVQESLPADQVQAEGLASGAEPSGIDRLARRLGALPWWVISATIHAIVFLLIGLLAVAAPLVNVDEVIISTEIAKQKEPEYDPNKKRDIFKNTKEVVADTKVDQPVVTHEKMDETDHFETDSNLDKNSARGQEDAISDIPLGGTGTVGSIGVGGGGLAGCFGFRDGGGRKKAVGRFGGSEATESSVEAALRWLSRHQEADGHWDAKKLEAAKEFDGAITGLATLAFLGAGYTEKSGKFADNVRRAVQWMTRDQKPDGSFRSNEHCYLYGHGMITLALCESYGMAPRPELGEAAQKAVDFILKAQGPYEAWTYSSKHGVASRNDTSVSGWQVMALKSAKIAGLKVDGTAFQGAMNWLDRAILRTPKYGGTGWCAYAAEKIDAVQPGNGSPAMAAAGMIMRQFMGVPRDDQLMQSTADLITTCQYFQPSWPKHKGGGIGYGPDNFYYWYYGTLAMFQMGGKHWEQWNTKVLKDILVPNQCKGGPLDGSPQDTDGSWDPLGGGGVPEAGRTMSTAFGCLCLEVYYRYLPMYTK